MATSTSSWQPSTQRRNPTVVTPTMEFNATRVNLFHSSPVSTNHAKHKHRFTGRRSTANTRLFLRHCNCQQDFPQSTDGAGRHLPSATSSKTVAVCSSMSPPPVLVHLTRRHAPWASLPLLARVAASPAHSSTPRRAACPHVGHGPKPTLEAPREGLRQGEVRGGAGRKLSRPRSETKCCGGFPGTPPGSFSARWNGHGDQTRETRIHKNGLQSASQPHI